MRSAQLAEIATAIGELLAPAPAKGDWLSGEAHRLASARLRSAIRCLESPLVGVAVVGPFSAGKSTLCNALVGHDIMPVGWAPTTSALVRVQRGCSDTYGRVHEGRTLAAGSDLADASEWLRSHFAGDAAEPASITVSDWRLPDPIVLLDAPGLGSEHSEHDEMAAVVLDETVATLFVVPPKGPAERDHEFLKAWANAHTRCAVVVNMIDTVEFAERDDILAGISRRIARITGHDDIPLLVCNSRPISDEGRDEPGVRDVRVWIEELAANGVNERIESARLRLERTVCGLLAAATREREELKDRLETLADELERWEHSDASDWNARAAEVASELGARRDRERAQLLIRRVRAVEELIGWLEKRRAPDAIGTRLRRVVSTEHSSATQRCRNVSKWGSERVREWWNGAVAADPWSGLAQNAGREVVDQDPVIRNIVKPKVEFRDPTLGIGRRKRARIVGTNLIDAIWVEGCQGIEHITEAYLSRMRDAQAVRRKALRKTLQRKVAALRRQHGKVQRKLEALEADVARLNEWLAALG